MTTEVIIIGSKTLLVERDEKTDLSPFTNIFKLPAHWHSSTQSATSQHPRGDFQPAGPLPAGGDGGGGGGVSAVSFRPKSAKETP